MISGDPNASQHQTHSEPPPAESQRDGPREGGAGLPTIDRIPFDAIRVGAGGPLVVPREDIGVDLDAHD